MRVTKRPIINSPPRRVYVWREEPDVAKPVHFVAMSVSGSAPTQPPETGRGRPDGGAVVAIFGITWLVEGLGVSQVFAFLPSYLREMGVAEADRLPFVGLFGSLIFVVGAPFVPLWGVWADKYSRKAVIVRSALV